MLTIIAYKYESIVLVSIYSLKHVYSVHCIVKMFTFFHTQESFKIIITDHTFMPQMYFALIIIYVYGIIVLILHQFNLFRKSVLPCFVI